MTSQEDYDKITFQFQNLEETYDELLECKVIAGKEDLKRYGVTGWDAGRICFLARACREMNYITEEEAWQYIDIAYEMTKAEFSSWHDMAMSYIVGRSLWGGKKRVQLSDERHGGQTAGPGRQPVGTLCLVGQQNDEFWK